MGGRDFCLRKSSMTLPLVAWQRPHSTSIELRALFLLLLTIELIKPTAVSSPYITLNTVDNTDNSHSQDESEVEKEASPPPKAQEKKDESQIVSH